MMSCFGVNNYLDHKDIKLFSNKLIYFDNSYIIPLITLHA